MPKVIQPLLYAPIELAVDSPNAETLAAIDDVNDNRNMSKAYDDMSELMRDLNA